MNLKIQVTTLEQYNMIDDLINHDYSRFPFLNKVVESLENKTFLGSGSGRYDNGGVITLRDATHLVNSLHKDEYGILYADIKILDTPSGLEMKSLIDDGYEMVLFPGYIQTLLAPQTGSTSITDFTSLIISIEMFRENDIYTKIIRNNKIDSLLK